MKKCFLLLTLLTMSASLMAQEASVQTQEPVKEKKFTITPRAGMAICCDMLSAINQTERQELFNEYILSFPEWQNDSSSMPSYLINPDLYGKDAIPETPELLN